MFDEILKMENVVGVSALVVTHGTFILMFQGLLLRGMSAMLESKYMHFEKAVDEKKKELEKVIKKQAEMLDNNQRSLSSKLSTNKNTIEEKSDKIMDFLLDKYPKK